ncbi:MAG TPA: hypothetical protein VL334_24835 [Anaerolineae bacterium]|nr:hypothetical protein [Anaerolineae bacterium]
MTEQNDSEPPPNRIDFGEDNTFHGPVAGGDQENYDLQGAQGPVIKPQGPVTQIWNQYQNLKVPLGLRILFIVLGAVVVFALIAIVVMNRQQTDMNRHQAQISDDMATQIFATPIPTFTPTITPTPLPTHTPTPTPTPERMSGGFNIIVAEFGELDGEGNIHDSEAAQWLSKWLAQQLDRELANTTLQPVVWHDQVNRPANNPQIGRVANEAEAQAQMEKFGAEMLIYGTLDGTQDPGALQLNYAWRFPWVRDEPDAVTGRQRLGSSVSIPNLRNGLYKQAVASDPNMWRRVNILAWLSQGLALDLNGHHKQARDFLVEAKHKLDALPQNVDQLASDGQQVLDYFLGREYLTLNQLKEAEESFTAAKDADPDYVNAYLGLGNVSFNRASFYFIRQQPLSSDLNTCAGVPSADELAANADQLPITDSQALTATQQAIDSYQLALDKASGSTWQPMTTVAQYMLGRAYRLKGQVEVVLLAGTDSPPQATDDLLKAEGLITPTLQQFGQNQLYGFRAYAYFDLASAQYTRAAILERQGQTKQALAVYISALENYQQCSAQQWLTDVDGTNVMQKKIACICDGYELPVGSKIDELGGAVG